MLEPIVEAAVASGGNLPELIVEACAGVAAVTIAVLGVLKGMREWREASIRRVEGMHVVPSDKLEGKLDMLIDTVNMLGEDQKKQASRVNMKFRLIGERVAKLEKHVEMSR